MNDRTTSTESFMLIQRNGKSNPRITKGAIQSLRSRASETGAQEKTEGSSEVGAALPSRSVEDGEDEPGSFLGFFFFLFFF